MLDEYFEIRNWHYSFQVYATNTFFHVCKREPVLKDDKTLAHAQGHKVTSKVNEIAVAVHNNRI